MDRVELDYKSGAVVVGGRHLESALPETALLCLMLVHKVLNEVAAAAFDQGHVAGQLFANERCVRRIERMSTQSDGITLSIPGGPISMLPEVGGEYLLMFVHGDQTIFALDEVNRTCDGTGFTTDTYHGMEPVMWFDINGLNK